MELPEAGETGSGARRGGHCPLAAGGLASGQEKVRAHRWSIVLIDESGFMLQPVVRRTWASRGQTPIQTSWDRHHRLSVISAITVSGVYHRLGLYFQIHEHNITYEKVMDFLTMVHRHLRRQFIAVLDRYSAHRKAVRLLQAQHPVMGQQIVTI
jgi:hypothetical protein